MCAYVYHSKLFAPSLYHTTNKFIQLFVDFGMKSSVVNKKFML